MALDRILHGNEALRTEAEALADQLQPLTEEQVASLTDDRLRALHQRAKLTRLRIECRDDHLTDADYAAMRVYRSLESLALGELEKRAEARAA